MSGKRVYHKRLMTMTATITSGNIYTGAQCAPSSLTAHFNASSRREHNKLYVRLALHKAKSTIHDNTNTVANVTPDALPKDYTSTRPTIIKSTIT